MKTEIKILMNLMETNSASTIRELSKSIKADYRITHTAVGRLHQKKLIDINRIGNARLVKLSSTFSEETFQAEFARTKMALANKNLLILLEDIKPRTTLFTLILFGSYANGTATKSSDIDLLFIIPCRETEEKIKRALSILPLKLHTLFFTEEEFREMKNSHKPNVVHEAIKNHIILYGIEAYYELIK